MQKNKRLSITELMASKSTSIISQNLDSIKGGLAAAACHAVIINNQVIDECTGKPPVPETFPHTND